MNGKCQFVAKYENAKWAEWHFVSPDGTRDIDYTVAQTEFPTLKIVNGYAKDMTLENIPEALNGWRVYCRFSNDAGSVKTERATITVAAPGSTVGYPKVTKSPTNETVLPGGSAYFVAKHEGALWAVWHFVSPDGNRDLVYSDAANEFTSMQIIGGDQGTLQLKNIPAEFNGWKVYCSYRNNIGTTNTSSATVTVQQSGSGTASGSGTTTGGGATTGGTVITASQTYPTGSSMTAYTADGTPVYLAAYSDGTWRTANGVFYYLGQDKVLRSQGSVDLYIYSSYGETRPTGNSMTVYASDGSTVVVTENTDGTWRSPNGTLYYLGDDNILRSRGAPDLTTYSPIVR